MLAVSRSACRATRSRPLDPFHPGSGPVTPMVTVLRSQSSRHLLRPQGRGDQQPRRQNHRRRRAPNRVLVSRVEDEVRPRPEQVGRQRDHDEPRTAPCRRKVGLGLPATSNDLPARRVSSAPSRFPCSCHRLERRSSIFWAEPQLSAWPGIVAEPCPPVSTDVAPKSRPSEKATPRPVYLGSFAAELWL